LIFIVSLIVMVVVSYMSEVPDYAKISGLTFGTRTDEQKKTTRESWSAIDVIASGIVLALILIAYIYFSG